MKESKILQILKLYEQLDEKDQLEIEEQISELYKLWRESYSATATRKTTFEEEISDAIDILKNDYYVNEGLLECHDYFPFPPRKELGDASRFVLSNFALSNYLFDSSKIDSQDLSRIFQALSLRLALREIFYSFSPECVQKYKHLLLEGNKIWHSKADKSNDFPVSPRKDIDLGNL